MVQEQEEEDTLNREPGTSTPELDLNEAHPRMLASPSVRQLEIMFNAMTPSTREHRSIDQEHNILCGFIIEHQRVMIS